MDLLPPPWTMAAGTCLAGSLSLLPADSTDGKGSVGPGESIRSGPFTEGQVCGLGFGVRLTRGCILLPLLSFDFLVCEMCLACRPALLKNPVMSKPPRMAMIGDRHKTISLLKTSWGIVDSFVCVCKSVVWTL